jgi:signal transduction histidine kinase
MVKLYPTILTIWLLIGLVASVPAQPAGDGSGIPCIPGKDTICAITNDWKYHPGDDPAWADLDFDDSDWLTTGSTYLDSIPGEGWTGYGWFRAHLKVDSKLWHVPVGFDFKQLGASDIYLNGRLIKSFGKFGRSEAEIEDYILVFGPPAIIRLDGKIDQVIAVRHSDFGDTPLHREADPDGFTLSIMDLEAADYNYQYQLMMGTRHQMFFTGLALTFCLLHLMMFLFYSRLRANLIFALFTASIAALSFFPAQISQAHTLPIVLLLMFSMKLSVIGVSVLGLWFLNSLFYPSTPRHARLFYITGIIVALLAYYASQKIVYIYATICLIESARVVWMAVARKKNGSGIIGSGYLIFMLASLYQMLIDMHIVENIIENYWYWYLYGILALLISMSIYLARQYAQINTDLADQLAQVKKLSAKAVMHERAAKKQEIKQKLLETEIAHKAHELEEAKKLEKALNELKQAHDDLKTTQTQLVQSEKMASLGQLVAGVAHEINTPIGAVGSMHDTLVRALGKIRGCIDAECDHQDCAPRSDLLKNMKVIDDANSVIAEGVGRVTNIVKRLRSFARLDEAELKTVDIHEGLEDTLTLIYHDIKHGIKIDKHYGDLPPISCYPGRLNQVFLNLLVNARQAMAGEGVITITTDQINGKIRISITDTGSGIPEENLAKIFDPGFTTKGVGVGTGLGLSICYQIIQDHLGEIKV